MSATLRAERISKRLGDATVLDGASLSLASGELVAVLGPSGAGKTTLFRCLTRLVEPDSGEIFICGKPLHALRGRALAAARRDVGVVFQQFNLIRRRTALDNVLAGRLGTAPLWRVAANSFSPCDRRRAEAALASVGLSAHARQRADSLSGGQQQRVAIARALAQESRIILADEPVASLDPETAISVLSLLRSLARDKGLGVICTLHQPQLAERFADRVLQMRAGRLVG